MLSDLQMKKLTRYFQVYDVDDDGKVGLADFERVVENVRVMWGESERSEAYSGLRQAYAQRWETLLAVANGGSGDGIDLDEWLAYWQLALSDDARYEAEVQGITDRLLRVFDLDEDGSIGRDEFAAFYGVFGLGVDLSRSVFAELDTDGDGRITRDELVDAARQFYRSSDVESPGNLLYGPYGA